MLPSSVNLLNHQQSGRWRCCFINCDFNDDLLELITIDMIAEAVVELTISQL